MESSDSGKGASSSESNSDNFLPEADEIIEASWATAPEHSKTFFTYPCQNCTFFKELKCIYLKTFICKRYNCPQ